MNTSLVDALVQAVLSLSSEEQAQFVEKLQHQKQRESANQLTELSGQIAIDSDETLTDSVLKQLWLGREERIQQQDEILKEILPAYNPPAIGYDS